MANFMKFLLVAIIATVFSNVAFGQSVQADLDKKLKAYKLVKMDATAARKAVDNKQSLTFQTPEDEVSVNLTKHNLYAPDYSAISTTANGRKAIPRPEITTYQGTVSGNREGAAFSLDGRTVVGVFRMDGRTFFIEPAKTFAPSASTDDYVVYEQGSYKGNGLVGAEGILKRGLVLFKNVFRN